MRVTQIVKDKPIEKTAQELIRMVVAQGGKPMRWMLPIEVNDDSYTIIISRL